MAFQFVHVSVHAREKPKKQGKGKDRKWTVRDIAGEVERRPENSPHIVGPKEPIVVFGIKATEAAMEAERRAEQSKDVSGRKIRKDTPIMLSGVASHPVTVDQLVAPASKRSYDSWKRDTLAWLKEKYGSSLLSVVEHLDEKHPHLHFYAVPNAGNGFNAKQLHDGFAAALDAQNPAEQKKSTAMECEPFRTIFSKRWE